jgi:hypothetical protein
MLDLVNAIAAFWLASGIAGYIAILDQRIQTRDTDFPFDLYGASSICLFCGPFIFWVAKGRLWEE